MVQVIREVMRHGVQLLVTIPKRDIEKLQIKPGDYVTIQKLAA